MQRQDTGENIRQHGCHTFAYSPMELTPKASVIPKFEASRKVIARGFSAFEPCAIALTETVSCQPLTNAQCQTSANGAVHFYNYANISRTQVTQVFPSMVCALEVIETPLWALLVGAAGLVGTSLLFGFALGVAITVGFMGLLNSAALVLSYVTVSASLAIGSVYFLAWHG